MNGALNQTKREHLVIISTNRLFAAEYLERNNNFNLKKNNILFKKLWILPIRAYQIFISPLIGPNCRYEPTCSHYMIGAIDEWGVLKGTWLGIKRIGRCHPWGGHGHDPVPKKEIDDENK